MKLTCDLTGQYKSANGVTDVWYYIWLPKDVEGAAGIVQLVHGMNEHAARYEGLARVLTNNNYIVCMNEHLGHGKTAGGAYGFFGDKDGHTALVEDVYALSKMITEQYQNKKLFIYGHSMGSFITRAYLSVHGGALSGAIISGTSGGGATYPALTAVIKMMIAFKGANGSGEMFGKINQSGFIRRFKSDGHHNAWLSRDKSVWEEFDSDEQTRFHFTLGGYRDMLTIMTNINKKEWAATIPDKLPLFLLSGVEDPVGDYGRGVLKVYDRLQRAGHKDTYIRLYEGGRHEMHNETNKDEVFADVLFFLEHGDMTLEEE